MDYLVAEGYPGAAEKFAQETNLCNPIDLESIRERVRIRNAIHTGKVDEAIEMINEIDPEVCCGSLCPHVRYDYFKFSCTTHIRHSRALMIHNYTSVLSMISTLQRNLPSPYARLATGD